MSDDGHGVSDSEGDKGGEIFWDGGGAFVGLRRFLGPLDDGVVFLFTGAFAIAEDHAKKVVFAIEGEDEAL